MKDKDRRLFSFGLVADIQYVETEDRLNYSKTNWRRYRNSLICLREAVSCWKNEELSFVTQLGDLIDGFNCEHNNSKEALRAVLEEFQQLPLHSRIVNVMGNHELYNFSKAELASLYGNGPVTVDQLKTLLQEDSVLHPRTSLGQQDREAPTSISGSCKQDQPAFYYTFAPHPRFRVVVLDSFDVSVLGREESSAQYKEALGFITQRNKNVDLDDPTGLEGMERRFTITNGGVGEQQLLWLEKVLEAADKASEKVIILSHVPFNPKSCPASNLLWNYQDVLELIQKFGCVISCFYGHDHGASHVIDSHGIHYCMIEAVVETPANSNSFRTVHVKEDRLVIEGHGRSESLILKF